MKEGRRGEEIKRKAKGMQKEWNQKEIANSFAVISFNCRKLILT